MIWLLSGDWAFHWCFVQRENVNGSIRMYAYVLRVVVGDNMLESRTRMFICLSGYDPVCRRAGWVFRLRLG